MLHELGSDRLKFGDERLCACGDMKPPGASVIGVPTALHEARFFEAVDDSAQCDRLEIEHIRQLDLAKARSAGQLEQHLPLGARDSKAGGKTIKRLAQSVRGLADFEGESFHEADIVSVLILSNAVSLDPFQLAEI